MCHKMLKMQLDVDMSQPANRDCSVRGFLGLKLVIMH